MFHNFHSVLRRFFLVFSGMALLFCGSHAKANIPQSATLAWDAEADPTVAGYRVYYGTQSGQYPLHIDVGNSNTATIPNLSVGSTYYFVVTAYDASNQESAPSQEVAFTVYSFSGEYGGSVAGAAASRSGGIKINMTASGAFTGSLTYGSSTYRLNGVFNSNGQYQTVIERGNNSIVDVALTLTSSGTGYTITGSIDDGLGASPITAESVVYSVANPAPYAGRYTILIESGSTTTGTPAPIGTGVGTLTVSTSGQIAFAGVLADGTPFSERATLEANGVWNVFIPLYGSNAGMLEGTIQFENIDGVSDLDGTVAWVKPANSRATFYPAGFTVNASLIGSAFDPVASLVISPTHTGIFQASGGNLVSNLSTTAAVTAITSSFVQAAGPYSLALDINRNTGLVTGSFLHPNTGEKIRVNAIVFQKQGFAQGSFTSNSQGSALGGAIGLE
jgi:hypothetical protein